MPSEAYCKSLRRMLDEYTEEMESLQARIHILEEAITAIRRAISQAEEVIK